MGGLRSGFFGKLPIRGDFLQAGLAADFVSAWDAWLQQILHQAQTSAADTWLEKYLAMPIWHFALAGGVCGAAPVAGILVTSVDRAGRYFPITIAVMCPAGEQEAGLPMLIADRLDIAYALEDAALAVLQGDLTYETFADRIESLPLPQKCRFLTSLEGQDPSTSLQQTLVRDSLRAKRSDWRKASLWWARLGDGTCLIDEDGLPNPDRFATILLGLGDMTKVHDTIAEIAPQAEPATYSVVLPEVSEVASAQQADPGEAAS